MVSEPKGIDNFRKEGEDSIKCLRGQVNKDCKISCIFRSLEIIDNLSRRGFSRRKNSYHTIVDWKVHEKREERIHGAYMRMEC